MSLHEIIFVLVWVILAMAGCVLAIVILYRRGRRGLVYAILAAAGTIGSGPLFMGNAFPREIRVFAAGALPLAALAILGLRRPKIPRYRCWNCRYDFEGETESSSGVCPECGEPRPTMKGHCLKCRADIGQAIAGGSDTCPHCRARIPPPSRGMSHFRG